MAKRRNPKKEKALRNRAYARQFRKQANTSRFSRKRPGGGFSPQEEEMAAESPEERE